MDYLTTRNQFLQIGQLRTADPFSMCSSSKIPTYLLLPQHNNNNNDKESCNARQNASTALIAMTRVKRRAPFGTLQRTWSKQVSTVSNLFCQWSVAKRKRKKMRQIWSIRAAPNQPSRLPTSLNRLPYSTNSKINSTEQPVLQRRTSPSSLHRTSLCGKLRLSRRVGHEKRTGKKGIIAKCLWLWMLLVYFVFVRMPAHETNL